MIVYRDLNIDEWWVYKDEQWWHARGWELRIVNNKPQKVPNWTRTSMGPSLGCILDEFVVVSTEGDYHSAKGYPIVLR